MMQRTLRIPLFGLAGLVMTASLALAGPVPASAGGSVQVAPEAPIAAPGDASRSFGSPPPVLDLDLPSHELVTGLAPGEDLADGANSDAPVHSRCLPNVNNHGACRGFRQTFALVPQRAGHVGIKDQTVGLAAAMVAAAAIKGVGALIAAP